MIVWFVWLFRNPSSSLPLHSHSAPVNAFAWSPISSQYIVSVGEDSHVYDNEWYYLYSVLFGILRNYQVKKSVLDRIISIIL